jgi:hypothetical protein
MNHNQLIDDYLEIFERFHVFDDLNDKEIDKDGDKTLSE